MRTGPKVIAILLYVLGGVMVVAGIGTYATVTDVLTKQNISVPTSDVPCAAGMTVNNPYAAWCMAKKIEADVLKATGGKTYAQLPQKSPNENLSLEGALLQSALYTAVQAFGVALLVLAVGVMGILAGLGIQLVNRRHAAAPAASTEGARP